MNVSRDRPRASGLDVPMFDDLQVVIPFRDSTLTKAALKYATALSEREDVRVRLINIHVVPYGVPLDEPAVDANQLERRMKSLARECELPISVDVIFARDWEQGFRRALTPGSIVLLPMRRASWQNR